MFANVGVCQRTQRQCAISLEPSSKYVVEFFGIRFYVMLMSYQYAVYIIFFKAYLTFLLQLAEISIFSQYSFSRESVLARHENIGYARSLWLMNLVNIPTHISLGLSKRDNLHHKCTFSFMGEYFDSNKLDRTHYRFCVSLVKLIITYYLILLSFGWTVADCVCVL